MTDCVVTLIDSRYSAPTPPAGYFRWLTSVVLRSAMENAGTTVCAPASEFEVELPTRSLRQVLRELHAAGATVRPPTTDQLVCRVTGVIAAEQIRGFEQRLPGLTHGEGIVFSHPGGYQPVEGRPPRRRVSSTGTRAGPAG